MTATITTTVSVTINPINVQARALSRKRRIVGTGVLADY
jgi:hypothetical protein